MSDKDLIKRLRHAALIRWQQSSPYTPIETFMESEAADRIESQAAKIERLTAENKLLERLVVTVGDYQQYQDQETFEAMDNALAALKETTE